MKLRENNNEDITVFFNQLPPNFKTLVHPCYYIFKISAHPCVLWEQ